MLFSRWDNNHVGSRCLNPSQPKLQCHTVSLLGPIACWRVGRDHDRLPIKNILSVQHTLKELRYETAAAAAGVMVMVVMSVMIL